MTKIRLFSLLSLLINLLMQVSFFFQISTRPTLQEMNGWFDAVRDDKKHLSPFIGFVETEIQMQEKIYRFLVEAEYHQPRGIPVVKKVIKGGQVARLVHSLFRLVGSDFRCASSPTGVAFYFHAAEIGSIVAAIENAIQAYGALVLARAGTEVPRLDTDKIIATLEAELTAVINKAIIDFEGLGADSGEAKEVVVPAKKSATSKEARKDGRAFVRLISEALKESGEFGGSLRYVRYTVQAIFLSFLYQKVTSGDEFNAYCAQFTPSILKEDYKEVFAKPVVDEKITARLLEDSFVASGDKLDFVTKNFETIALTVVNETFYKQPLPKFSEYESCTIAKISFPPCVENVILNFVRVLMVKFGLYDRANKVYRAEDIGLAVKTFLTKKGIVCDEKILNRQVEPISKFFKKFPKADVVQGLSLQQQWAELVSNVPGVKYLRAIRLSDFAEPSAKDHARPFFHPLLTEAKGYEHCQSRGDDFFLCEVAGCPSSFVVLTNYLFGTSCKTFAELCDLFEMRGTHLEAFSDDVLYTFYAGQTDKDKALLWPTMRTLTAEVDKKAISLDILATVGHAELTNRTPKEASVSASKIKLFGRQGLGSGLICQLIYGLSCVLLPKKDLPLWTDVWISRSDIARFFYLSQNLFNTIVVQSIIKEIVESDTLRKDLGCIELVNYLISDVTRDPDDIKLVGLLKGLTSERALVVPELYQAIAKILHGLKTPGERLKVFDRVFKLLDDQDSESMKRTAGGDVIIKFVLDIAGQIKEPVKIVHVFTALSPSESSNLRAYPELGLQFVVALENFMTKKDLEADPIVAEGALPLAILNFNFTMPEDRQREILELLAINSNTRSAQARENLLYIFKECGKNPRLGRVCEIITRKIIAVKNELGVFLPLQSILIDIFKHKLHEQASYKPLVTAMLENCLVINVLPQDHPMYDRVVKNALDLVAVLPIEVGLVRTIAMALSAIKQVTEEKAAWKASWNTSIDDYDDLIKRYTSALETYSSHVRAGSSRDEVVTVKENKIPKKTPIEADIKAEAAVKA